jgi:alkylation response protein AidB-like acyl-CoA dehydrogenase
MDLSFSAEDERFRAEVRDWLASELPSFGYPDVSRRRLRDPDFRRSWENHLCNNGWSGLSWPAEYGGRALPLQRQVIFWEEYALADAPMGVNLLGHGILGPTLIVHGDEAQKNRFLPKILTNEEIWCQGYSEPNAGSDLASLGTRAERRGESYVLSGQKVWTSFAQLADWCFVLARTDVAAPKHKGISFLLVDMRAPGVEVRPINQITGESEFSEVHFDGVEVPVALRVGSENDGWRIAMAAAAFERGTYFIPRQVRMLRELQSLVALARRLPRDDGAVADDPVIRDRIARLYIDVCVMRLHSYRTLTALMTNDVPGAESSYTKLFWSETHQELMALAMDILGPHARYDWDDPQVFDEGRWQRDYLWTRAETILAGTSEIQRNVIAERSLGLPR